MPSNKTLVIGGGVAVLGIVLYLTHNSKAKASSTSSSSQSTNAIYPTLTVPGIAQGVSNVDVSSAMIGGAGDGSDSLSTTNSWINQGPSSTSIATKNSQIQTGAGTAVINENGIWTLPYTPISMPAAEQTIFGSNA